MSINARVNAWIKSNTASGVNGLILVRDVINHAMGESGDWTPIAKLMKHTNAPTERVIRGIVTQVLPGIKITKDPKGEFGIRLNLKEVARSNFMSDKLESLIADKAPLLGKAVAEVFLPKKPKADKPKATDAQTPPSPEAIGAMGDTAEAAKQAKAQGAPSLITAEAAYATFLMLSPEEQARFLAMVATPVADEAPATDLIQIPA
ncbi:hypothetical protein [Palleronia sp.]|uniref:hypothetical protein n=1 Tax=Palleronia sp. TaxID=1940284 RepID=UPI0035C81041